MDHLNSKAIKAIVKDSDTIYEFDSIRKASTGLDVARRNIQTYINYDYYLKSSVLGEYIKFFDSTLPMKTGHPNIPSELSLYSGIDFNSLPSACF